MQAGKLRHRVTIQTKTLTQDPVSGVLVESWSDVAKVWASVEPLSVRDLIAARANQSEMTARVMIRYREILPTYRLVHRGQVFSLVDGLPDTGSGLEYLTIPVSEGVNDG